MHRPATLSHPGSKFDLIGVAMALGARSVPGWSDAEELLVQNLPPIDPAMVQAVREDIRQGLDPIGDAFCQLLSPEERRPLGATYTPASIIQAMVAWTATQRHPVRIIDPGTGSARFLVAAGHKFQDAELIGVEIDPVAAILARGHLAAAGLTERAQVIVHDYRELSLPRIAGHSLYIGNPPYVRHHLLDQKWKSWLVQTARKYHLNAS